MLEFKWTAVPNDANGGKFGDKNASIPLKIQESIKK
jgi:hypothetical protein